MDKKIIGERLRTIRGSRTRADVAEGCGVSKSSITMYELGNRVPSDQVKLKLAAYLKFSIEEVFFTE